VIRTITEEHTNVVVRYQINYISHSLTPISLVLIFFLGIYVYAL